MHYLTNVPVDVSGLPRAAVILSAVLATSIIYCCIVGLYRVYLSPLARFPGPKLAALTTLYQIYYDIWLGGQYYKKLNELHEQYGPIIRINPHEIHVKDISFIDELYAGAAKKRDKFKWSGRQVLLPDSLVATRPHDLHRKRRAVLNPFFSKASVRKLDPSIQHGLEAVLARLEDCAKTNKVFHASLAFKAATCDVITEFCFGVSTGYIYKEDYEEAYFKAVDDHLHMSWPMAYIPWLGELEMALPPVIMGFLWPGLKSLWAMHARWTKQIEDIRTSDKADSDGTIFHGILRSDLPPPEKSTERLRQEAQLLVLAGQDTTAYTLSMCTYEILSNSSILQKLQAELRDAIPDPTVTLTSARLEQLPYLAAIVNEAIRLHPGVVARQTRIAPNESLVYTEANTKRVWHIPPGTAVCMDAMSCNLDPTAFPDPHSFNPERWIENPRIDRHMMSFSKGTRICLGMNLSLAELYIILAGIFRTYDKYDGTDTQSVPTLELYDTDKARDIDQAADYLVPFPTKNSKGVQLRVRTPAVKT